MNILSAAFSTYPSNCMELLKKSLFWGGGGGGVCNSLQKTSVLKTSFSFLVYDINNV